MPEDCRSTRAAVEQRHAAGIGPAIRSAAIGGRTKCWSFPGSMAKTRVTDSAAASCCESAVRPFRPEPARHPAGDFRASRHGDAGPHYGGPGFGKAKSVILLYLQGGPSHLDLWDPKTNVPDNVKSVFSNINTKLPGVQFTENLPKLAKVNDKITLIRSMSYTPIGLFNHTAAIYQMLTGYTADNVSPSGQLEPPSPKDFPNFGCNIVKMRPPEVPMLPYVMMPRPLQESNVIGKAGTAGFLGRAYDPYYLYPPGDDLDMNKMERINIDDLLLRKRRAAGTARTAGPAPRHGQRQPPRARPGREELRARHVLRQGAQPGPLRPGAGRLQPARRKAGDARALRPQHVRPIVPAGPPPDRGGNAGRRGQLAQGRQFRPAFVGRPRRPAPSG